MERLGLQLCSYPQRTKSTGKAILLNTTTSWLSNSPSRKQVSIRLSVLEILEAARDWDYRNTIPGEREVGAHFAFFQQKIEWVRLKEQHPDAFEEAKAYEKDAVEHGSPFTWSEGESLEVLEQPERIKQIRQEYEQRLARMQSRIQPNPLRPDSEPLDIDDLYGQAKVCLACHK